MAAATVQESRLILLRKFELVDHNRGRFQTPPQDRKVMAFFLEKSSLMRPTLQISNRVPFHLIANSSVSAAKERAAFTFDFGSPDLSRSPHPKWPTTSYSGVIPIVPSHVSTN